MIRFSLYYPERPGQVTKILGLCSAFLLLFEFWKTGRESMSKQAGSLPKCPPLSKLNLAKARSQTILASGMGGRDHLLLSGFV